jgi:Histidine kinase-like ATPase domain
VTRAGVLVDVDGTLVDSTLPFICDGLAADEPTLVVVDAAICEVRDRGYLDQPLAGRESPARDAEGGRGLWLANQFCDLVQIRSSEAGTVVRLHKSRRARLA